MWKQMEQTYWQANPFRAVAEPGIQLKVKQPLKENSAVDFGLFLSCAAWTHTAGQAPVVDQSFIHTFYPCLLCRRRWSLKQAQASISAIPSGTPGTPQTRWSCCGKTLAILAGRTRRPTAGSCNIGLKSGTSGEGFTASLVRSCSRGGSVSDWGTTSARANQSCLHALHRLISLLELASMKAPKWWRTQELSLTQLCEEDAWESSASPKRTLFGQTCVTAATVSWFWKANTAIFAILPSGCWFVLGQPAHTAVMGRRAVACSVFHFWFYC